MRLRLNHPATTSTLADFDRLLEAFVMGVGGAPARVLQRAFDRVLDWQVRSASRAHLAGMDDRLLDDMGISRAHVEAEAAKPFWRS